METYFGYCDGNFSRKVAVAFFFLFPVIILCSCSVVVSVIFKDLFWSIFPLINEFGLRVISLETWETLVGQHIINEDSNIQK